MVFVLLQCMHLLSCLPYSILVFKLFASLRILKGLGDDNFNDDNMKVWRKDVIEFIANLFREKVADQTKQGPAELSFDNETRAERRQRLLNGNNSVQVKTEPGVARLEDDGDDDDEEDEFILGMLRAGNHVPINSVAELSSQMMMEDMKKSIEEEIQHYEAYCKQISWPDVLAKHGNDKYKQLVKGKDLKVGKLSVNPRYTRSLFDVMGWWKNFGYSMFPRMAVAASIMLPKAAHNAFQERVFSIGTFLDTKQQKRRTAIHYEMDVLSRINSTWMLGEETYEAQLKDESDDKRKVEYFFKLTDELQQVQAEKGVSEETDDSSVTKEDDEVSVDVPLPKSDGDEDDADNEKEQNKEVEEWIDIADSDSDDVE